MKTFSLFFIALLIGGYCKTYAQDIISDQDSEPLVSIPKTDLTVKLSSKNIGFTFPIPTRFDFKKKKFLKVNTTQYYVGDIKKIDPVKKTPDTINTMKKSIRLNGSFNLLENTKNTVIFSKISKVTPSFEISINNVIDEFQAPDVKSGIYWTGGIAASIKKQSFHVYDKTAHTQVADYKAWNPGARVHATIFWHTATAISVNGSWQHAVETSDLADYRDRPADFFEDPNAVSNGTTTGYFAPVNAKSITRLSIASPIFSFNSLIRDEKKGAKRKYDIVPTPYYYVSISDKTVHNAGFGVSVMPSRFYRQKNPKLGDTFSFSYNLLNSDSRRREFYISGTFNLGIIFPTPTKEKAQ